MASRMTEDEWRAVIGCCTGVRHWPARAVLSRKGEPLDRSLLLLEGMVGRYVPGPHRDMREMVALEVAGDFVDIHSFPIKTLDHDVIAMTDAALAVLPHAELERLLCQRPGVARALWAQTVFDAAIHRYWSFRVGALRSVGRVANFICELHSRLERAGLAGPDGFALALTQTDMGEACGMSAAHVNRVVRELREAECCIIKNGYVTILDLAKLHHVGRFEPYFLDIGSDVPGP